MKKFLKNKRKLSESSEDADDPGAFTPSPVRGGVISFTGQQLPGGDGVASSRSAAPPHEEEGYHGSYSTEMGFQGLGSEFKRPKMNGEGDRGRRFSQASTNSSASFDDTEGTVDRDAALLSRTLDSTSSSDTEDEFSSGKTSFATSGVAPSSAPAGVAPIAQNNGFYSVGRGGLGGGASNNHHSIDRDTDANSMSQSTGFEMSQGQGDNEATSLASKNAGGYSSQAERMMSLMGYRSGTGLGKAGEGRLEPVTASSQRGRRGLGHIIEGLESDELLDWTPEHIEVREPVLWLPTNVEPTPTLEELRTWLKTGRRNEDISGETKFCNPETLADVLSCKSVFDKLESHELMKARTRSNPFETIGKGIFQNRAAMKMANMDTVFGFMFTDPRDQNNRSLVDERSEPLYFADVCAGPGGFSEYVLWKKKWQAKGFGFTLKDGKHDFKLEEFYAGPPEGFEPYYGVDGYNGDGNVFRTDNMKELERYVKLSTGGKGVHFMMADGGFSVEGSENIQEILSKQLYLCQIIVAMAIVREQGHFVCKLFDLFTPFSVGLLYLMYRSFQQVCIHKPNTSRPANSERYIICKGKRSDTQEILDYLYEVNGMLESLKFDLSGRTHSNMDVNYIVPQDIMNMDQEFLNYVIQSNDIIGKNQVLGLEKIAVFYKNRDLYEKRQAQIRRESLEFWNIPDGGRIKPRFEDPQTMIQRLLQDTSIIHDEEIQLNNTQDLEKHIKSIYDWRYVVIGAQPTSRENSTQQEFRTFLVSTGRQRVSYLAGNGRWQAINTVSNCRVDLPAETILYVEVLWEMKGESKAQKKVMCIHVIDAMFLAGQDIRDLHLTERIRKISIFLKVMNKPSQHELVRMRPKNMFKLEDIISDDSVWTHLSEKSIKGRRDCQVFTNPDPDSDGNHRFFQVKGLYLYRHVKDPYIIGYSKSRKMKYFFNTITQKPCEYNKTPQDGIAGFNWSHKRRLVWNFRNPYQGSDGGLDREDLIQFINAKR